MIDPASARARTAAANEANRQRTAERAAHDPRKLANALRTVRAALGNQLLSVQDLLPSGAGAVETRSGSDRAGA
ncbi:hypothetical protein ACFXJ5_17045 [Streptomyces sp. NPDC059373]